MNQHRKGRMQRIGEAPERRWHFQFSSVQSLSRVQLSAIPWTAAHQASLSITSSHSLLKLMYIELVMPSNHLIICRPLLLPSVFPSIRVVTFYLNLNGWVRSFFFLEEKNSKGISDRGNHMCKDRFEGSRPVLGSARSWKCLKHRISVEVAPERGF